MVPYVLIGIFAVIGLFLWGLWGLLGGAVVGFLIVMAISSLLFVKNRGYVPKKIKRESAEKFIQEYEDVVKKVYPDLSTQALQHQIESEIESIFFKAMTAGSGPSSIEITTVVEEKIENSNSDNYIELLRLLLEHIKETMYPVDCAGSKHTKVHPEDEELIQPEDIEWFSSITVQDVSKFEAEDNVFKMAAFKKYMDEDGLSDKEAAAKCRKYFPFYYYKSETREKDPHQGEDALLPYCLKYRINQAAANLNKAEVESVTTMNAFIRQKIKEGHI